MRDDVLDLESRGCSPSCCEGNFHQLKLSVKKWRAGGGVFEQAQVLPIQRSYTCIYMKIGLEGGVV